MTYLYKNGDVFVMFTFIKAELHAFFWFEQHPLFHLMECFFLSVVAVVLEHL